MNQQLFEIINKQQQHEYLKKQLTQKQNYEQTCNTPYLNNIKHTIKQLISKQKRKRLEFYISGLIVLITIVLSILYFSIEYLNSCYSPKNTLPPETYDTPGGQIQIALDNNALLTARLMLEENMDTSSGYYSFYHLYIELCEKEGNYDEAVDCMIEYLTHLGKDEVTSENLYYKKLIDYEYPISEESQQKIDEFLT